MEQFQSPRAFQMEVDGDDRLVRIVVRGELDISTAPRVHAQLREAAAMGTLETVLDASGIDFIDSAGIGLLVTHKKRAVAESRRFVIATPSQAVLAVVALMGLVEYLDL